MAIKGIFFPNKILTSAGIGSFGKKLLSDGIIVGCAMPQTVSSDSITIGNGYLIMCGKLIEITDSETVNNISGAGYITVTVNMTDPSNVSFVLGYSADMPTDTHDLNMGDATYTGWIASIVNNSGTLTVTPRETGGSGTSSSGMAKLWTNTDPASQSGIDDAFIEIDISNHTMFHVLFMREPRSSSAAGKCLTGHTFYVPQLGDEYDALKSSYYDISNIHNGGIYYRASTSVPDDSTQGGESTYRYSRAITFFRGTTSDKNGVRFGIGYRQLASYYHDRTVATTIFVPIAIYGLM